MCVRVCVFACPDVQFYCPVLGTQTSAINKASEQRRSAYTLCGTVHFCSGSKKQTESMVHDLILAIYDHVIFTFIMSDSSA